MEVMYVGGFIIAWLIIFEAAYQDFTKRLIPDLINAALWAVMVFLACFTPSIALVGAFAFTIIFGLNSAFALRNEKPLLSWGDVLLIPPVAGIMGYVPASLFVLLLALMFALFCSYQKEEPLAPYILVAYSVFVVMFFIQ